MTMVGVQIAARNSSPHLSQRVAAPVLEACEQVFDAVALLLESTVVAGGPSGASPEPVFVTGLAASSSFAGGKSLRTASAPLASLI